jgi:hypothetical protein
MAALSLLMEVQAPLDLIAVATRFPLDELVHVELCGRLLAELGGAAKLLHDPERLAPSVSGDAMMRCAEVVMRVFCVGEAVSIPILRTSARKAQHPLIRAVLSRIAKDEALHGQFGWMFLDWALDAFDEGERRHLTRVARDEIGKLERAWATFAAPDPADSEASTLGWMPPDIYYVTAHAALDQAVLAPLTRRGLDPRAVSPIANHPG